MHHTTPTATAHSSGLRGREAEGGRRREGFDRRKTGRQTRREGGRKRGRETRADAFLIDGPKNLCVGRLLCFDIALIGHGRTTARRASTPTQTGLAGAGGREAAAGEPRIHHGGEEHAARAVDLRGPTGDPENELTISITHEEGDEADAARNIIQGKGCPPAPAPAPTVLRDREIGNGEAAMDVTAAGKKRGGRAEHERKKITCRAARFQARPGPRVDRARAIRSLFQPNACNPFSYSQCRLG